MKKPKLKKQVKAKTKPKVKKKEKKKTINTVKRMKQYHCLWWIVFMDNLTERKGILQQLRADIKGYGIN